MMKNLVFEHDSLHSFSSMNYDFFYSKDPSFEFLISS